MPPRVYKTEALVLRQARLGEADAILTLYTPFIGKLRAAARGLRRPQSKLAGHLEPLSRSSLMLSQGQNMDVVTQAQSLESFLPLRADLWRSTCAVYAAELVDRFTEEHISNNPLYKLLVDTLGRLCQVVAADIPLRYFEIHMLEHLGYRPELERCLGCNGELASSGNLFSASSGGGLCPGCGTSQATARPISAVALKVLRLMQKSDYTAASRMRLEPALASEVEGLLRGYLHYLLEREVKSTRFLDRLRREDASLPTTP
ncbi:MAG: DNA repair protein RecO [Chloroflexi bacterium]|nr:DNA repair protein RecO [Chloroflexota bacterium]